MAPMVHLLFWELVMRRALSGHAKRTDLLKDFRAPFAGVRGCWRLMGLLRWGDPVEVLTAMPGLLQELRAATLIFQGSSDPVVPESFARRAASLISNSELLFVNAGHFIPLSQPVEIATALSRFFGKPASIRLQPFASPALAAFETRCVRAAPKSDLA